jgi:hypothetical protein
LINPRHLRAKNHSILIASTGFAIAARKLCKETDSADINKTETPAKAKIHQSSEVW